MRRDPQNARRFNDRVILPKTVATVDSMSHAAMGTPRIVLEAYAKVRQMSATKTSDLPKGLYIVNGKKIIVK